ncbi:thioredoxin-like protein [Dichotomocladium elegans]|nr:thioredoxin-like protein [Dichotomocladium elegans]
MQTLKIDIISDTVCPWCFIGKRRLEKAMDQFKSTHPNVIFDVVWHPFELNSHLGGSPKPKEEHYIAKFGKERMDAIFAHLKRVGALEGIAFDFGGVIANTLASHRLMAWSRRCCGSSSNSQSHLVEAIFHDYFEQRQDIADYAVLAAAAERVGLDKDKALAYLNSNEDVDTVRNEAQRNQWACQDGVPNYKIQDRFTIAGAQDPSVFLAYFEKALNEQQTSS